MLLTLQAATKHIGRVISRMPRAEVMPLLQPHLLPGLFEAFKHASADVRKATVFCLVDLWLVSCPHCAPCTVQLVQLIPLHHLFMHYMVLCSTFVTLVQHICTHLRVDIPTAVLGMTPATASLQTGW